MTNIGLHSSDTITSHGSHDDTKSGGDGTAATDTTTATSTTVYLYPPLIVIAGGQCDFHFDLFFSFSFSYPVIF